jgi:excisionase family DNA binding protein
MIDNLTLLTTKEAADYLRLGKPTLESFRVKGIGPKFLKLGGSVRYRRTDLDAWLASRVFASTSEASQS